MEDRCIICGAIIPEGMMVCPACMRNADGVKPTWRQGKAYCSKCGKRIPRKTNAHYCHKCGTKIDWQP